MATPAAPYVGSTPQSFGEGSPTSIGPIQAHAGLGVASLLTGGLYPTIGDSVYVDLNVKYVK